MIADADVIIRYFTKDDPLKAVRFRKYLQAGNKITITDVTFAEVYWTLTTFYKYSKDEAIDFLEGLIGTKTILCNHTLLNETIRIFRLSNISFIDSYTSAYALFNNSGDILSFDRGFDRIKGIKRHEP